MIYKADRKRNHKAGKWPLAIGRELWKAIKFLKKGSIVIYKADRKRNPRAGKQALAIVWERREAIRYRNLEKVLQNKQKVAL